MRLTAIVLVALCLGCSLRDPLSGSLPGPRPRLGVALENPCDILTVPEVAAITGLRVSEAHRTASMTDTESFSICSYTVGDDPFAISIWLPPFPLRSEAEYRRNKAEAVRWAQLRAAAVRACPRARVVDQVQRVPGIGVDAWTSTGGAHVSVLVNEQVHFRVWSRVGLMELARAIVERLRE